VLHLGYRRRPDGLTEINTGSRRAPFDFIRPMSDRHTWRYVIQAPPINRQKRQGAGATSHIMRTKKERGVGFTYHQRRYVILRHGCLVLAISTHGNPKALLGFLTHSHSIFLCDVLASGRKSRGERLASFQKGV
jgi:hypothetical protein